MKNSPLRKDLFLSLFIVIIFILISIFLPTYDALNGFHNIFFDDYELSWYDGKSPVNFQIIKNILEGKSIFFPKGYVINNIPVENNIDLCEKDDYFIPNFNFFGNYVYSSILYMFFPISDLQLFKATIFLTIIFNAITILLFYYIQRSFGLNQKYSFISALIAGIATSVLIYSKYLFTDHTISALLFIASIYILLQNQKKKSFKIEIFAVIIFSFFLLFLWVLYLTIIFFVVFYYLFIKYGFIHSKKIPILVMIIVYLFFIPIDLLYLKTTTNTSIEGVKNIIKIDEIPVFSIFSNYINALDYSVFGYHNQTSSWKLYRRLAPIYAFEEFKGNAVFLAIYGLFGSLFGPRGFVFNSPYLIFSILGIFAYKKKKEKNLLLVIIILIILTYSLFNLRWQGGYAPRYIRYFTIPILFLTFFSFYYIQEIKNNWVKLIFFILVLLSVLNVTSLSIRTDWNYEHEADLVSYDLVLWPWYTPSKNETVEIGMKIDLTYSESVNWILDGEDGCKASFKSIGLMTDPCYCVHDSWGERKIRLENDIKNIEASACTGFAGNDGTKGFFYVDEKLIGNIFIESDSCASKTFKVNISSGDHIIKLKSGTYGNCSGDIIFWKSIKFE